MWDSNRCQFRQTTLKDLGLRIQLGHHSSERCEISQSGPSDFTVIASNGIHVVNVLFCACPGALSRRDQLLEFGWWPATEQNPQLAFTMEVLRKSHIINLEARTPLTELYRSYVNMTYGTGIVKTSVRFTFHYCCL